MTGRKIAAIDIGGTKIKVCLFDGGEPWMHMEAATEASGGSNHVLERAAGLLRDIGGFDALGVSTAGQVDPVSGVMRYANDNIPGYTGVDVRSFFIERFGVKTAVVNDVYAAALGESVRGGGVGEPDFICLTFGTGIGGGIILSGRPYYGSGNSAGVMLGGIVTHSEAVVEGDPFSGTFERFASTSALIAAVKKADPSLESGRAVFTRLDEPEIKRVVDAWLDEVAAGVCTLIHAFNIPCVLLGGGVMEQDYAVAGAKERISSRIIPGFRGARVQRAKLGNMAGLFGAMHLAQQLLNSENI